MTQIKRATLAQALTVDRLDYEMFLKPTNDARPVSPEALKPPSLLDCDFPDWDWTK